MERFDPSPSAILVYDDVIDLYTELPIYAGVYWSRYLGIAARSAESGARGEGCSALGSQRWLSKV